MLLLNYRLLLRETINDFNAQHFLVLVVAAQCNKAGHYIFALWFLVVLSVYVFPRLISAVAEWMSTILLHMVWP